MLIPDWRVAFFRHVFLRHTPQRYAVMLSPHQAQRLGQKYTQRRGAINDAMIAQHLAGRLTLAAPAAAGGQAHLLPLDIDAGGLSAIRSLIAASARRELWAFAQYCPRHDLADEKQRGYVWLPFDRQADSARLQALGAELFAASGRPGWKTEARATHAATRLPLARHTHTGRFGDLIIGDQIISIDRNPAGALAELHDAYRENSSASLPELPPQPQSVSRPASSQRYGQGLTISHYNQIPQSEVVCIRYADRLGVGKYVDRKNILGNLPELIDKTADFLELHTRVGAEIHGFKREDLPEYPIEALREAVVNAVVHRDYSRIGETIRVFVYADRVRGP